MLDETQIISQFAVGNSTPTIQTSVQQEKDVMMDMFSIDFYQSQGDKGIYPEEEFLRADAKQHLFNDIDTADLNFFDSVIGETDQTSVLDTTMNIDLKELLSGVLSEETVDLSTLDFGNISSEIASQELSYNLNSLHAVFNTKIQHQDIGSSQTSCPDVTSTTVDGLYLPTESELNTFSLDNNSSTCDSVEVNETLAGKKYIQMRQKNNIASQKSRKMRKQKNLDMAKKLKTLEKENKELLLLAKKLEDERDALQKKLMSVFVKK